MDVFRKPGVRAWFRGVAAGLAGFSLLYLFVLDFFVVNSRDMESSFSRGDLLLVSKSAGRFSRGEVVLLRYSEADSSQSVTQFIQRLVALPGDCVSVINKVVFVNGVSQADLPGEKHNYFIKSRHKALDSVFITGHYLLEGGPVSEGLDYSFSLSRGQKEALEKDSAIESIQLKCEQEGMKDQTCFQPGYGSMWNVDFYGPLYVPKRGDKIDLDSASLSLYEDLIVRYEKNSLEYRHDSIFVNGSAVKTYTVQQDYYFVLGDNRDNATDSRRRGFLPESDIRGKVLCRLKKGKL
ncbi:MAG TPA: signal peptidase I [Bacteroidia bacterium]|nr:signal peptidase I [Bacteroidia bacterium]